MKLKKLFYLLAAFVLTVSMLFVNGCSDEELHTANALIELAADVISETNDLTETKDSAQGQTSQQETQASQQTQAAQQATKADQQAADTQETASAAVEENPSVSINEEETLVIEGDDSGGPGGEDVIDDSNTQLPTMEEGYEETGTLPSLDAQLPEDGEYLSMEQVSLYLHLYGHLPGNYLTKNEAKDLGWVPSKGNLWDVAPGCAIGGDRFGNREKLLPEKKGRKYYECDVNYSGGDRDAERIVFSNDGLVYYTDNHYEDFMLLFDGTEN